MHKSKFKPAWYTDPVFFEKEKNQLFNKVWLYAGLKANVKAPGDYFTLGMFGLDIVVHNIAGKLFSYLNVCPHRGGPLVLGSSGNGAAVCKYHGWSFATGKELTGVSNLDWFNNDKDQKNCGRSLKSYSVETIGPFVFIFLGEDPISINNQFSEELIEKLKSFGNTSVSIVSDFVANINWKLNMENVKDFLHPYYVHAESFKPVLGYPDSPTSRMHKSNDKPVDFEAEVELRDLSLMKQADFSLSVENQWWASNIVVTLPNNSFENIFLFPNTNLYSVSGGHYVTQQYFPLNSDAFLYRLSVILPEMSSQFDASTLLQSLLKIERDVIYEDELVLNKIQKNMYAALDPNFYTHGDYERAIVDQMMFLDRNVYCD